MYEVLGKVIRRTFKAVFQSGEPTDPQTALGTVVGGEEALEEKRKKRICLSSAFPKCS